MATVVTRPLISFDLDCRHPPPANLGHIYPWPFIGMMYEYDCSHSDAKYTELGPAYGVKISLIFQPEQSDPGRSGLTQSNTIWPSLTSAPN